MPMMIVNVRTSKSSFHIHRSDLGGLLFTRIMDQRSRMGNMCVPVQVLWGSRASDSGRCGGDCSMRTWIPMLQSCVSVNQQSEVD